FSSRRRHTRFSRDWSSDVCSSDLGWRRAVLRAFGARIGRDVRIHPTVRIAVPWNLSIDDEAAVGDRAILYSLGRITIGKRATISQYAHLCAGSHDYRRRDLQLLKLPIIVG